MPSPPFWCLTLGYPYKLILCSGLVQKIILITNSFPTWLNPVTDMDNGFTVNFPVFIRNHSPRRFTLDLRFQQLVVFEAFLFLNLAIEDYEDTCLLSTLAFNSFKSIMYKALYQVSK